MAFNQAQFRECIVRPTLQELQLYSPEAEELLIMTMAHESKGGTYFKQMSGPALGVYQMEPRTYDDIWAHYIANNPKLMVLMLNACQYLQKPPATHLLWNLKLSTMMARVYYVRIREVIPEADNLTGLSEYAKKYWNTSMGKATPEDYLIAYNKYMGKKL